MTRPKWLDELRAEWMRKWGIPLVVEDGPTTEEDDQLVHDIRERLSKEPDSTGETDGTGVRT